MSESTNGTVVHEGWPHPDFAANWSKIPWEVLEPYQDRYVAYTPDGTRILTSGVDRTEVYARMKDLGLATHDAVVDYVDPVI